MFRGVPLDPRADEKLVEYVGDELNYVAWTDPAALVTTLLYVGQDKVSVSDEFRSIFFQLLQVKTMTLGS